MANKKYSKTDLAATKVQVQAGPNGIMWLNVDNTANTAKSFLQLFDALSANVTVGSTVPTITIVIPGSSAYDTAFTNDTKLDFATGLTIAATTTATGSSAPVSSVGINANLTV